jgi:hypothetical protein
MATRHTNVTETILPVSHQLDRFTCQYLVRKRVRAAVDFKFRNLTFVSHQMSNLVYYPA